MEHHLLQLVSVLLMVENVYGQACLASWKLKPIPSDHLYSKLKKPLVIGHMGSIEHHQENTIAGINKLIQLKADGVHMQVQLSSDNKLLLFREDNLYRMTGRDYEISSIPYSEIVKMDLLQTIEYNSPGFPKVIKKYAATAKIPLLKSALDILKGQNMLVYIELMPDHVPPRSPFDRQQADTIAKLISRIIKQNNMEKKVFIVSKDAYKLKFLNHYASNIVFGWWIDTSIFTDAIGNKMRSDYHDLLDMYPQKCFQNTRNGTLFTKYLLTSGIISKAVNASFVDVSIEIYNDTKYFAGNNQTVLKDIVRTNYGNTSLGSFHVFSWDSTNLGEDVKADVKFIEKRYQDGVQRFITNDINRVKIALHEVTSNANLIQHYFAVIILTLLCGKAVASILFL